MVKDAFFAAFHSVPRKISRRHLCKPERIVTNPALECGNLPPFMPEYASTTFYNSNKVSRTPLKWHSNAFSIIQTGIVCASGTKVIGANSKTGKFTPNIKCKTKKHWDGIYKWVHVGPTGKYSPLKLNSSGFLDQKCKFEFFRFWYWEKSFRPLQVRNWFRTIPKNKEIHFKYFLSKIEFLKSPFKK